MSWGTNSYDLLTKAFASTISVAKSVYLPYGLRIEFSSGDDSGNYLVAIRPGKQPELVYRHQNSSNIKAPYVPCMIARDDKLYLLYDRGFAGCIDAPSGKIHWSGRTGAAFNGSPVLVRDKIYCIDEDGIVWVIAADPTQLKILAKNDLGENSSATPAVSGGRMFLRTLSHLFCVGGAPARQRSGKTSHAGSGENRPK